MSERSELFSLPDLSLPAPGTPEGATTQRSLSWLTFFGETKKVSSRRATPGEGLIEERKSKLPNRDSRNKTPHKSNTNTPVLARETQGINQRLEAFSFSLKNPSL